MRPPSSTVRILARKVAFMWPYVLTQLRDNHLLEHNIMLSTSHFADSTGAATKRELRDCSG